MLVAVKLNFRPYIRRYTSPNEILNTVIPHFILIQYLACKCIHGNYIENHLKRVLLSYLIYETSWEKEIKRGSVEGFIAVWQRV